MNKRAAAAFKLAHRPRVFKKACKGALTLRQQRRSKTRYVELFIPPQTCPLCRRKCLQTA